MLHNHQWRVLGLPEAGFRGLAMEHAAAVARGVRALLLEPRHGATVAVLLLAAETVLNLAIIRLVPCEFVPMHGMAAPVVLQGGRVGEGILPGDDAEAGTLRPAQGRIFSPQRTTRRRAHANGCTYLHPCALQRH